MENGKIVGEVISAKQTGLLQQKELKISYYTVVPRGLSWMGTRSVSLCCKAKHTRSLDVIVSSISFLIRNS